MPDLLKAALFSALDPQRQQAVAAAVKIFSDKHPTHNLEPERFAGPGRDTLCLWENGTLLAAISFQTAVYVEQLAVNPEAGEIGVTRTLLAGWKIMEGILLATGQREVFFDVPASFGNWAKLLESAGFRRPEQNGEIVFRKTV